MADLFDYMEQEEIAVDEPAHLPAVVESPYRASEDVHAKRMRRLSDAGMLSAIGLEVGNEAMDEAFQWQVRFLFDFIALPALKGRREVRILLDNVVRWCRDSFGGDAPGADGLDWSTSRQFRMVDAYLARLVSDGILAHAPNRLDFDVRAHVLAAFRTEPRNDKRPQYWWEMLGLDIPSDLYGNESVVAREIHDALARVDAHWRAWELEDCVREAEIAFAAGAEIDDNLEDGMLFRLDVLRNWLKWEVQRRDLGGFRWDPYKDGVGPITAEQTHRRFFGEQGE